MCVCVCIRASDQAADGANGTLPTKSFANVGILKEGLNELADGGQGREEKVADARNKKSVGAGPEEEREMRSPEITWGLAILWAEGRE